jgi:hypothetical protein
MESVLNQKVWDAVVKHHHQNSDVHDMAQPQAKSQAKPGQSHGLFTALAWLEV